MSTQILFDFDNYNLTSSQLLVAGVIFVVILSLICYGGIVAYGRDMKKLAWLLSLVNSFLLSVIGIMYLSAKGSVLQDVLFNGKHTEYNIFTGNCNAAVLTSLWFALANIFDLGFGSIYYPKYLGLLTAWIHHSVFIWIMLISTTGNGIFMTATPFSNSFLTNMIEEIPTFLLALGSIFPMFRTDIGFGLTFFLFRICYHVYIFYFAIFSNNEPLIYIIYGLTTLLHLHWFYAWISKYGVKKLSKKPEAKSI